MIHTILGAIFYRLGGYGKPFNTKVRDFGVTLVGLFFMFGNGIPWYLHLISFGLFFAALTTYWDFITGEDEFFLHGLFCSLAYFPYVFYMGWGGFLLRALFCAVTFKLLNLLTNKYKVPFSVWIEELYRGAALIYTLRWL